MSWLIFSMRLTPAVARALRVEQRPEAKHFGVDLVAGEVAALDQARAERRESGFVGVVDLVAKHLALRADDPSLHRAAAPLPGEEAGVRGGDDTGNRTEGVEILSHRVVVVTVLLERLFERRAADRDQVFVVEPRLDRHLPPRVADQVDAVDDDGEGQRDLRRDQSVAHLVQAHRSQDGAEFHGVPPTGVSGSSRARAGRCATRDKRPRREPRGARARPTAGSSERRAGRSRRAGRPFSTMS